MKLPFKNTARKRTLNLMVLLLLLMSACNKSGEQLDIITPPTNEQFSLTERGFNEVQSTADLTAYMEVVNEDYEHWGKWVYEHYKYFSYKKLDEYMPVEIRQEVNALIDSLIVADGNLNSSDKLNSYLGSTTSNIRLYSEHFQKFKVAYANAELGFESFSDVWNWLRTYEKSILQDQVTAPDNYHVLVMCSIMRNFAKIIHEQIISEQVIAPILGSAESREGGCIFKIKWTCWSKVLLDLGITALDIAIIGASASTPVGIMAAFKSKKGLAAFLKFVKSTLDLFGSDCKCGSDSPAPNCTYPTSVAIHILKDSCHNRQTFEAVGGDLNRPYIFILFNGKPSYLPISPDNRYFSPIPFFQVTPIDPAHPTTIGVYQECDGTTEGAKTTFSANFNDEVFKTGTIGITGPSITSVGQTNTYNFTGTWTANENNFFTPSVSYHGQITNMLFDKVNIKWNSSSQGQGQWGSNSAYVSGQLHNRCSTPGSQSSTFINVSVY